MIKITGSKKFNTIWLLIALIIFLLLSARLINLYERADWLIENDPFIKEMAERVNKVEEVIEEVEEYTTITAEITAYTKHDPGVNCISASQKNICWVDYGVAACPIKYPFDTIIELLTVNDEGQIYWKEFICLDRMGTEYFRQNDYFDLWFDDDLEGALQFGRRKNVEVRVYGLFEGTYNAEWNPKPCYNTEREVIDCKTLERK